MVQAAENPKEVSSEILIQERALEVLASTAPEGDFFANAVWGRDFAVAYQRDPAAFFILDVREWSDYCLGHIEGALHLDFHGWAHPANLARLPRDRKVIVVCENGCASAQVSAGLRLLGYDALVLNLGMAGWVKNPTTRAYINDILAAANPVAEMDEHDCRRMADG